MAAAAARGNGVDPHPSPGGGRDLPQCALPPGPCTVPPSRREEASMKSRAMTLLAAVVAAAALAGCASFPGTARPATFDELRREEGWLLLDSVPFVRQVSGKGCGAACLAMVLRHWGDGPAVEELERECFAPGQDGIRASDLRDAARRRGLAAYLFRGTLDDLEHELARGRPVVVGLAKPAGGGLLAHFEVVVGIHRARGRIAALDPARGLVCDSLPAFEGEWTPANGVTLVVFLPEEVPVLAGS